MKQSTKIINRSFLTKEYLKIVLLALGGSIGMALYFVTDGLFIGNVLADDGLSAISISYTIVYILIAIGSGIGFGGSIRYTLALEQNQKNKSITLFRQTLSLLGITGLALTIGLIFSYKQIMVLFGASGYVLELCNDYGSIIAFTAFTTIISIGIIPLARNTGGEKIAAFAIGAGYLMNILFDYILMVKFPLGMTGCAMAYVIGQITAFIIVGKHIYKVIRSFKDTKNNVSIFTYMPAILKTGAAPFGLYFCQSLVTIFLNSRFLTFGDSESLAVYSVLVYAMGIMETFHRTIMEASQPLISSYYGKEEYSKAKYIGVCLYVFSSMLIIMYCILIYFVRDHVFHLFGVSVSVGKEAGERLFFYMLVFFMICLARRTVSYLTAMDKNKLAVILTYSEPIFNIILLMILPNFWQVEGIWYTLLLSYGLLNVLAIILLIKVSKELKNIKEK